MWVGRTCCRLAQLEVVTGVRVLRLVVFKGGEAARKGGSREWRAKIYQHCRRVRKAVNKVHVTIYKLFPCDYPDALWRTRTP